MLLVWLFGAGLGVANACWAGTHFKQGGQPPPVSAAHGVADGDQATPECALHGGSRPDAQQDAGPGTGDPAQSSSNCQTYCDGVGVSITPLKTSLDEMPALSMAVATGLNAAPVAVATAVPLQRPRLDRGRSIPITIAFLRLAL